MDLEYFRVSLEEILSNHKSEYRLPRTLTLFRWPDYPDYYKPLLYFAEYITAIKRNVHNLKCIYFQTDVLPETEDIYLNSVYDFPTIHLIEYNSNTYRESIEIMSKEDEGQYNTLINYGYINSLLHIAMHYYANKLYGCRHGFVIYNKLIDDIPYTFIHNWDDVLNHMPDFVWPEIIETVNWKADNYDDKNKCEDTLNCGTCEVFANTTRSLARLGLMIA